jgi:hypothetical protein
LSIHIPSIALLAVALLLALKGGFLGNPESIAMPSPTISTTAHPERIVVMPTAGGRPEGPPRLSAASGERPGAPPPTTRRNTP